MKRWIARTSYVALAGSAFLLNGVPSGVAAVAAIVLLFPMTAPFEKNQLASVDRVVGVPIDRL